MTSERSLGSPVELSGEPPRGLLAFVRWMKTYHPDRMATFKVDMGGEADHCAWCKATPLERAMVLATLEDEDDNAAD